jgi:TonB-linked SusC/RagA family outer membrane protein
MLRSSLPPAAKSRPVAPLVGRLAALLAVGALLAPLAPLAAQATGRLTGTVTDSASGRPLDQVQVSLAGSRLGAGTDEAGRFTLVNIPAGSYTVEARRLGYQPVTRRVEIAAGATATVTLAMRTAALNLQAIVTTGVVDPTSGTRVPFTVGRVSAEQIPIPPTNAVEALAGRVAGAQIVTPGQPGSGINVQLRSPTSINKGNQPLIVVDGVILGQTVDAGTADLNALDIESIEVVKGAAAASLYGSRASNGVVQIRTKRGAGLADGRTQVTTRLEYGQNAIARPIEFSQYHAFLMNEQGQYVNAAGQVVQRDQRVQRAAAQRFQDQGFPNATFNPIDQFFSAGDFSQSSVSLAQNAGRTNFFVTLSNQQTGGVVLNAGGYTRNDVRVNLDHRVRDDLTFAVSSYYSRSNRSDLDDDLFFDLVNQAPDLDLGLRGSDGEYVFQPDVQSNRANPLYTIEKQDRRTRRGRFLGNVDARYAPLSWLSFNGNASYDRADRSSHYFLDRNIRSQSQVFDRIGGMEMLNAQTAAMNASGSMNLLGRRGDLTARSSVRALMERENGDRFGYRGTGLLVPTVRNQNNVTSRLPVSNDFLDGTPDLEIRTNSFIGTAGLDYAGKYIVDGLVRRDGSSLFGPEEQWQTFYRASASWRMGEESWFPFRNTITEFKPRISRGTAGGRPSFPDQYETYTIDATGNLVKATLGNRFLRPELATETEAGLDLIVRNRYSLQLSYARNVTSDQLVPLPLPAPAGGFETQWQNAGTLKGNTFEGTFEAQMVQRKNVGWTLGVVADRSRNTLTEFNRSCFISQTIIYRCAGVTMGTMYGARFAEAPGELLRVPEARQGEFQRNDDGLLVWTGANRDWRAGAWGDTATIGGRRYSFGVPIVVQDSVGNQALRVIGDGNPAFRWGVSNNVRWRGLTVFALVDAQVGGDTYNRTKQRMYQYYRSADVDQADKPQENKKPLQYYDGLYNANNVNQWFVESASNIRLRELSVRANLGGRFLAPLQRLGASGVSVSLIGRNLFLLSDYSGYDPEIATETGAGGLNTRIDDFQYPRFRTVTGSLQIQF